MGICHNDEKLIIGPIKSDERHVNGTGVPSDSLYILWASLVFAGEDFGCVHWEKNCDVGLLQNNDPEGAQAISL